MTDTVKSGRWIITGQFQLITPMHIGTGLDEVMDRQSGESAVKKQDNPWIQAITLDQNEKPYIPGASIKGALKTLARRYHCASNLNIFGDTIDIKDQDNKKKSVTVAGQAEFMNAWYAAGQEDKPFDTITRVAIDRVTGTAVDRKLFNTRRVNPGACFDYTIIVQNACETEIQDLLGLLGKATKDPKFSLGAGANQTQGKIRCLSSCVRYFGQVEAKKWFQAIQNGKQERWQTFARLCDIKPAHLELPKAITVTLKLPLTLDFHTPFLVKADGKKDETKNEADAKPRTNHDGQTILPASSLRGRLRAQAERVLRTLGQTVSHGHESPIYKGNEHSDLISLLFGTAGWKGIIRTSDLIHSIAEYDLEFAGLVEKQVVLKKEGTSLIYVALTKVEKTEEEKNRPEVLLHICVFDSEDKKIIDKSENENWINDAFSDMKSKNSFKEKLQQIDDLSKLDEKEKLDIKNTAIKLATQTRHEMVAIDRFTGGGKEGAKFNVDYVECPTLKGAIYLDIHRLKAAKLKNYEDALKPTLGLISLLLRDLAEGDISFGFGANKGYGQCRENLVLDNWEAQLKTIKSEFTGQQILDEPHAYTQQTLDELRKYLGKPESKGMPDINSDSKNAPKEAAQDSNLDSAQNNVLQNDNKNKFHNPYHFIPLNNPKPNHKDLPWPEADANILKANKQGHDQYHTDKFSGRIVCRLTTKTPLFIGAETNHTGEDWQPSEAKPFKLNGKHAIPATSLRGMVSSLFESVSNSNFRVLHPEKYSMRKTMGEALSAMGRVILDANGNPTLLQPLTLPTLAKTEQSYKLKKKWQQIYKTEHAPLRIFFYKKLRNITNEYYYLDIKNIETKNFSEVIIKPNDNPKYPSTKIKNKKTKRKELKLNYKFLLGQESKNVLPASQKKGQNTCGWIRTLIHSDRDLPNTVKHNVFLPDTTGKVDPLKIPSKVIDRFHELSDLALAGMHIKPEESKNNIEILPYVPIGRSKEGDRPQKDDLDSKTPRYGTRLKEGDIVFFDVDENSQINEISFSSIWRHGIERNGDLLTSANLLAHHDCNLLPFGIPGRCKKLSPAERLFGVVEDRESKKTHKTDNFPKVDQAFGYTGKVRIGFGMSFKPLKEENFEAKVTLKELSSPKPPSPALYLTKICPQNKQKYDQYLCKDDFKEIDKTETTKKPKEKIKQSEILNSALQDALLSKLKIETTPELVVKQEKEECKTPLITLRGRKYYLHALREGRNVAKLCKHGIPSPTGRLPWESLHNKTNYNEHDDEGNKRRVRIEPIKSGTDFYFEIDFNNLDQTELAQLCATLQPTPDFEHRLGMGKPLGLGSIKIEPIGLYLINRHQRYATDNLSEGRYHNIWKKENTVNGKWPTHLELEQDSPATESPLNLFTLTQKGMEILKKSSPEIKRALELFGNPKNIGVPVHYPIEKYGREEKFDRKKNKKTWIECGLLENEGFKWFVRNDDKENNYKQPLKNITADMTEIPTLNKN